MPSHRVKKNVTVLTYHERHGLTVRLEYDHDQLKQNVYLNDQLMSSISRAPGAQGFHSFRARDGKSDETGYLGDYKVWFAVEKNSHQIRYHLQRGNAGGKDTTSYCLHSNIEVNQWERFPDRPPTGDEKPECTECGTELACPACEPPESVSCKECDRDLSCTRCNKPTCEECDSELECPECDRKCDCGADLVCREGCDSSAEDLEIEKPLIAYDAVRMQEELSSLDGDSLQSMLVEEVGRMGDEETPWPILIKRVLDEAGCDTSSIRVALEDASGDQE